MTIRAKTAAGAATLFLLTGAAPAGADETVRYRIGMSTAGTWTETVRADLAEGDPDHDGTEEIQARDSEIRFALTATMRDVPLVHGRIAEPHYDVADSSLTQDVVRSTYTDWYGTSGTCAPQSSAASGGGTLGSVGPGLVLRPSSDAVLVLECTDPYVKWSFAVDLLRVAAVNAVPDLGEAPIDAAFTIPDGRFGDAHIELPVAASAAQKAYERCPREDPGHTVACPFDWKGIVVLDRLSPVVRAAGTTARKAAVEVRCFEDCAPTVRAGRSQRSFTLAAGRRRRLTVRLDARTRRALRRTGRLRITVQVGEELRAFKVRPRG